MPQVRARLRVIRCDLECVQEIRARLCVLACPCFQHAEIVPAIGIVSCEVQRRLLFGDRLLQISGRR